MVPPAVVVGIVMEPLLSLNVQVTNPPSGTVKLLGVPEVHEEPVSVQPGGTVSETL
jgi:hypothetical protein